VPMKKMPLKSLLRLFLFVPMLFFAVAGLLVALATGNRVAQNMGERQLNTSCYAFELAMEEISGVFRIEEGELFKGDTNLTRSNYLFDDFRAQGGIDVTLFYGDTRYATSLISAEGERLIGTQCDPEVWETVKNGGSYFTTDIEINDEKYMGYYVPLYQPGNNEIIGMVFSGIESKTIVQAFMSILSYVIIGYVIITAFLVFVILKLMKLLLGTFTDLEYTLSEVAKGNLDIAVDEKYTRRKDEIGKISQSTESLAKSLKNTVTKIADGSESIKVFAGDFENTFVEVSKSVESMDVAVGEIAQSTSSLADETQTVNTNVESIGAAIDEVCRKTENLSTNAQNMTECNNQADSTISELVLMGDKVGAAIQNVYEKVNATNGSVTDIQDAADAITNITNQTNLLSLNASIEAARAGEQGRGFAVVADEIRSLADQSGISAKHITDILDALSRNSTESLNTMNEMIQIIREQNEKLRTTQQVFSKLNSEVDDVNSAIITIANNAEQLNAMRGEIITSVSVLAAGSEENAALTQEAAATMQMIGQSIKDCREATIKLTQMSETLDESVSMFKK